MTSCIHLNVVASCYKTWGNCDTFILKMDPNNFKVIFRKYNYTQQFKMSKCGIYGVFIVIWQCTSLHKTKT